jgi:hypothetical protein
VATLTSELMLRFEEASREVEELFADEQLADENVESQLRRWLDGASQPMAWSHPDRVTPDEWFFITTLYGEMTLDGQRSHIKKFFPSLFVAAAGRDVRNFVPGMPEYAGLRSRWMSSRLSRMGQILRDAGLTMTDYAEELKRLELAAAPENPMPALDRIVQDHRASGWKTLSVFVRDCVGGNCFPIDSRVEKELARHKLPADERKLVSLALAAGRNPRRIARMFYGAGGDRP